MNQFKVSELKAKERGLSEAKLIDLSEPVRPPPIKPRPDKVRPIPAPRLDKVRPIPASSSHEMDIFEKQEMEKKRPIVKKKLNWWFNWIVNFTPESIKEKATGAFKTFKNKILDLYKEVWKNPLKEQEEKEPDFTPIEQAFDKAFRRYRINADMKIDVETFFDKIRKSLNNLIQKELQDLGSAKIQTTIWLKFRQEKFLIEKAFNSKMTEVYQGSNFDEILENLFAFMKTQIENPAFEKSGFTLDRVLHLDIDFHMLNLTRGIHIFLYLLG